MDIMHIEIKLGKRDKINLLYQDKISGFALQDTIFEGTQVTSSEALFVLFLTVKCD